MALEGSFLQPSSLGSSGSDRLSDSLRRPGDTKSVMLEARMKLRDLITLAYFGLLLYVRTRPRMRRTVPG